LSIVLLEVIDYFMPLPEPRPDPFFIADHLALDFLNTIVSPQGKPIDWLDDGPSYLDWLRKGFDAHLDAALAAAKLDGVAARARTLREWFRGFVERHAGSPLQPSHARALRPLNDILARDHAHQEVIAGRGDGALVLRTRRDWREAGDLLQPVAHAIADLLCHADFTHVRRCEGAGCMLWFLDISKAHRRRWCTMSVCGNRAKVAQHRARRRQS
jgi:predicted RNA-binding Zn ribbon-like protein